MMKEILDLDKNPHVTAATRKSRVYKDPDEYFNIQIFKAVVIFGNYPLAKHFQDGSPLVRTSIKCSR